MLVTPGALLTIDLACVVANYHILSACTGGVPIGAVLKADAYGMGATAVGNALYKVGCSQFFVANLQEGIALRKAMPTAAQIAVLNGINPETLTYCYQYQLTPVLNHLEQILWWQQRAHVEDEQLHCMIHLDTGMHRLGMPSSAWCRWVADPAVRAGLSIQYVLSHLVDSEASKGGYHEAQREQFILLTSSLPGVRRSLANSGGIFLGSEYHFDLVRPGIALYGVHPSPLVPSNLQPVLRLTAPIIQLQEVACGEGIGYNHSFTVDRPTRVATISLGYSSGYPQNVVGGYGCVKGYRVPIVGKVSMDLITLDVTDVPEGVVQLMDEVTLLGEGISVSDIAQQAGGTHYALLLALGAHCRRIYRSHRV